MYYEIFQILSDLFYGSGAELTVWMEMTLTVISTASVLFCFAIPFVVVWHCLRFIFGLCVR